LLKSIGSENNFEIDVGKKSNFLGAWDEGVQVMNKSRRRCK
jgi:hypothetical protein